MSSMVIALQWVATMRAAISAARACLAWLLARASAAWSVAGALVGARERVVAIGVQGYPVDARRRATAGLLTCLGRQRGCGAPVRRGTVLARGQRVLVGVGVAARQIQGALAGAGPTTPTYTAARCWASVTSLVRRPVRGAARSANEATDKVRHIRVDADARACWDLGAARLRRRRWVAGLMGQQMRVVPPAARRTAVPHAYQVDLVRDARVGQEIAQVSALSRTCGQPHRVRRDPPRAGR